MKKLILITIGILLALPAFCQEEKLQKLEKLETNRDTTIKSGQSVNRDTMSVEVGDKLFSVKEIGNETKIQIGKKEYRVVEDDEGVDVYRGSDRIHHRWHHDTFRGHLGGIEFGLNDFLTSYWSTSLSPADNYFDLNTGKSVNWNFVLPCISLGFTRHFGLAASLGLNFNKYRFDGNNTIIKDENGVIGPFYPDPGITYSKSKFCTTYATLPVILEAQIPVSDSRNTINIGAGVIGAVKLGSHTKVVYYTDGKHKSKNKDDFSLNTLRWGATGRVGYKFFQVYGTCYFTQLFEKGKGPELFPYEVGIALTFND